MTITLADNNLTASGTVSRTTDDLTEKLAEHKREEIKIGAKVFLNRFSPIHLTEAIENLLQILNISQLDNVILAYHPVQKAAFTNGHHKHDADAAGSPENNEQLLTELKKLWTVLETFANDNKIGSLGIADLDTDTLQNLYAGSTVLPSIAQINLSACCVVPPSLQELCNEHEIQLLTHSDPEGSWMIYFPYTFFVY